MRLSISAELGRTFVELFIIITSYLILNDLLIIFVTYHSKKFCKWTFKCLFIVALSSEKVNKVELDSPSPSGDDKIIRASEIQSTPRVSD